MLLAKTNLMKADRRKKQQKIICHRGHRDHRGIHFQKPDGKDKQLGNLF
jgi:hypothetical protein